MSKLPVFITGNQNKADLLANLLGISLEHQRLDLTEVQAPTLEEVVEEKVKEAYRLIGKPVLVEDVSLGYDELNGMPGPFIKFFISRHDKPETSQEERMELLEKVCRMGDGLLSRAATAACVYAYYDGEQLELIRGELNGYISEHPRGENGFGWDYIFCPNGWNDKTRAEMVVSDDPTKYPSIRPYSQLRDFLTNLE